MLCYFGRWGSSVPQGRRRLPKSPRSRRIWTTKLQSSKIGRELERLRGESREETLLTQLLEAQGEVEKKCSKLQKRDSELQEVSAELRCKDSKLQKET